MFLAALGRLEANEGDSYTHAAILSLCAATHELQHTAVDQLNLIDGSMMTMAKANGPSVFLESHQADAGGLFRIQAGSQQSSRLLARTVTQPASRYSR